ncbi:MAG TPA: hypothetical protein VLU46_12235 [Thermoanaerobaculia bacterium]|nr:hypothetical protein [Thermoanaerobaculia bacterium]
MRLASAAFVLAALLATPAIADDTDLLLARAWPYAPNARVTEVGTGVAIVFSPDLSVAGNCNFYRGLGFSCFAETDWLRVLRGIHEHNIFYPERANRTVILETHGTNGNGLKLQKSYDPNADRSYISIGALQERLEPDGVRTIIISACNSGRLLRPSIYKNLDPNNGDKLFLPADQGIVGASDAFDPAQSQVTVITPASSHIEMTVVGAMRELAPATRKAIDRAALSQGLPRPNEFAVSDLLMQMVVHSSELKLRVGGGVDVLSREKDPEAVSEKLYRSFLRHLNALARLEPPNTFASDATR